MHTQKDAEIVDWVARLGAAGAEQVMGRFAMGQSWAYARLSTLVAAGLLEQRTLLHRQPGLYIATAQGLRFSALPIPRRRGRARADASLTNSACTAIVST